MKKILLVTRPIAPPWDEGSKNFAYSLAKNLPAGLDVNLMGTKENLPELPQNVRRHPVYTTSKIADFNLEQKLRALYFQWKTRGQFDINHYFFTPTRLNSFLIKNFLSSKNTKTVQTVATLREDLWSDEDIKKLMFSDLIITYSDYSKNKLNELGFQNAERVYPGIDLSEYANAEKNEKLLNEYNLTKSDFVINSTGEYVRLGAIDAVIDSFVEVAKKIPEARLSLAVRIKNEKDAAKKDEIIKKLKKHNLLDRVAFHDDGAYQMKDIYSLCDVSVFPVENMHGKFDVPLAVIEAMACEKPVILSDIPILREFANEKNSVTIEKGNAAALAQAILDLYAHPEKRAEIGREARKYAKENFDIKKVAGIYNDIYETL
ncbi:MAG: hypothetical protein QG620_404 [Patescibacteria group bacterium]|nr:hypothetical protein [Patescibacteria group bacterium]